MRKKSNNSFFVGLLSFFGGISQDIFVPLLPLYLANVLGLPKSFIGVTEGLVTGTASVFKVVSGFITDRLGKRKPIVFIGYFLSFVSRPFLAIIASPMGVLFLRFMDGVGKGIKDSPKDALIADSSTKETRGKEFGIVRALDTFGSVIGPLLLFALLYVFRDTSRKYQYIFLISAIPLIITLLIITFLIKETNGKNINPANFSGINLPRKFYIFLTVAVVFSIGNSSDAFLLLRAQNIGVPLLSIPLIYALFNFVYATASIPLGSLSDTIGRKKVIAIGWIAFALSYFGFGFVKNAMQVWILFAFYGLYYATTEGVAKAMIADFTTPQNRGRAYGIYNTAIGISTLPASFVAGFMWDRIGPNAPFIYGGSMALIAVFLLAVLIKDSKE